MKDHSLYLDDKMYVVYGSSDLFSEVTGSSMISLFENNKCIKDIHVFCIEKEITEKNKSYLKSIARQYGRTLQFIEMPKWSEKLNIELKSQKKIWPGMGYNRPFLPEIIPDSVDKILYLDSDTIVEQSLENLWNTDLNGYYMAAVDDCLSSKYRDIAGLKGEGTY